jgi:hypothetical protein
MHLKKEKGGSAIRWEGTDYEWPHDGSVTEVPDELGRELLAIPESGYERVRKAGEDDEDERGREFTEVVEVGYVLAADAPSTPGDGGEVPDRLSDRTAYSVTEEGEPETVPPEPVHAAGHPRVEEPGEGRAGVKDVDRATDADRAGHEGKHEAGRPGEPKRDDGQKRRDRARKPAGE